MKPAATMDYGHPHQWFDARVIEARQEGDVVLIRLDMLHWHGPQDARTVTYTLSAKRYHSDPGIARVHCREVPPYARCAGAPAKLVGAYLQARIVWRKVKGAHVWRAEVREVM
ncbi:MAG: hypothetical protein ACMV1D_03535 [Macromonas sp.]